MSTNPIRIGISSCLLGETVRFDGGHKRNSYCMDVLSQDVEWVPVCPEVEVGMGVPREAVRLVGGEDQPRMLGNESGRDWTDDMTRYAQTKVRELRRLNLDGYILKSKSPSCGMELVEIESADGTLSGAGLFARELVREWPDLPIVEEGCLSDSGSRQDFMALVQSHHRGRLLERDNDPQSPSSA